MRSATTTLMVSRIALRSWMKPNAEPITELAYIEICLRAFRSHRLCHVFLKEGYAPGLLWLLDRSAVECARLAFPLPLLRIANRLAVRLGRISHSDFEQANSWLLESAP